MLARVVVFQFRYFVVLPISPSQDAPGDCAAASTAGGDDDDASDVTMIDGEPGTEARQEDCDGERGGVGDNDKKQQ